MSTYLRFAQRDYAHYECDHCDQRIGYLGVIRVETIPDAAPLWAACPRHSAARLSKEASPRFTV